MRLVNADELKDNILPVLGRIARDCEKCEEEGKAWPSWKADLMRVIVDVEIDDMPTIDAQPVVRCKDCKYLRVEGYGLYCDRHDFYVGDKGFGEECYCAWGERKEEYGHWIGVEYDDNDLCFVIKCSECGAVFEKNEDGNWNYCPNCGAKMERRKE